VGKVNRNFDLVQGFNTGDYDDLLKIWQPFGWTPQGLDELQGRLQSNEQVWFSGIVDRKTNRLVSACMAESGRVGETSIVETTEYGTLAQFAGRKLSTAAVSYVNAQILADMYYANPDRKPVQEMKLPFIYAELSLTSRSDMVARNAGYDIPLRDRLHPEYPSQVLRHNVAVFDSLPANDLNLENINPIYHESMGSDYPFYRNFVPGVLPLSAVERYYSLNQVQQMLGLGGRPQR
jgi:hypothetical protein